MKRILRRRPSPAMIVALGALFISLGGVSYGVATGSIDSREIRNNTIRSKDLRNSNVYTQDIRNSTVRGRDIRNSTVRGRDVGNNTLTGSDILESSLGIVPNAGKVDGLDASAFVPSGKVLTSGSMVKLGPGETKTLVDNNGLKLLLKCQDNGGGNLLVAFLFESNEANSRGFWYTGTSAAFGPGLSGQTTVITSGSTAVYAAGSPYSATAPSGKTIEGVFSAGRNVLGQTNGCTGSAFSIG